MKVAILCGGLGTRLKEETEFRPKPLVEIGGKPILWHIMKIYSYAGFKDFVLCLGYKGDMIKNYFLNYETTENDFTIDFSNKKSITLHNNSNKTEDWRITFADTGLNSMTGARVKRIEKFIDGNEFMLTYGDGVANVNVNDIIKFHRNHDKIGTVLGVRPPSKFGEMALDTNRVISFVEKPNSTQGFVNGGFFVFKNGIFDYLNENEDCILEKEPLENLATNGQLMMYPHEGFWQCMDTYRDFLYLNQLWPNAPWKRLL
ncbi:MAG: glucose-1-phosphate cytidylyltransferase [Candidatus Aenigmarchaeota archaeon]|nr:glucose-1-phosphate cytidylyltransferase [Candidatus Aenigmarchaeota archaeon]